MRSRRDRSAVLGLEDLTLEDANRAYADLIELLLNAVYFKGSWTERFDVSETAPADFRRPDGSTVTVPMMHRAESGETLFAYGGEDYVAADLAYGGQAFSMTVVLPTGDQTLATLVEGMDEARWQEVLDGLTESQSGEGGAGRLLHRMGPAEELREGGRGGHGGRRGDGGWDGHHQRVSNFVPGGSGGGKGGQRCSIDRRLHFNRAYDTLTSHPSRADLAASTSCTKTTSGGTRSRV